MPHLIDENVDTNEQAFLYLNLHEGEKILFVVRHHWAGFLANLGIVALMALFPILIVFTANLVLADNLERYLDILVLALSGYFLFLLTFLFGSWLDFYYDVIFITQERILNVNQKGLLAREVSELSLEQVQNVSTQMEGILHSYFNFGTLIIETAGKGTSEDPARHGLQGYFNISDIPDPNRIARVILELHRKIVDEEIYITT